MRLVIINESDHSITFDVDIIVPPQSSVKLIAYEHRWKREDELPELAFYFLSKIPEYVIRVNI